LSREPVLSKVEGSNHERIFSHTLRPFRPSYGRRKITLKQIALFSAAVAFALLAPNLIHAQDRAGVLQGVVKDSSGAPVAGALVKLKNGERRLTFMVVTQA
jgi:hypothetical protein